MRSPRHRKRGAAAARDVDSARRDALALHPSRARDVQPSSTCAAHRRPFDRRGRYAARAGRCRAPASRRRSGACAPSRAGRAARSPCGLARARFATVQPVAPPTHVPSVARREAAAASARARQENNRNMRPRQTARRACGYSPSVAGSRSSTSRSDDDAGSDADEPASSSPAPAGGPSSWRLPRRSRARAHAEIVAVATRDAADPHDQPMLQPASDQELGSPKSAILDDARARFRGMKSPAASFLCTRGCFSLAIRCHAAGRTVCARARTERPRRRAAGHHAAGGGWAGDRGHELPPRDVARDADAARFQRRTPRDSAFADAKRPRRNADGARGAGARAATKSGVPAPAPVPALGRRRETVRTPRRRHSRGLRDVKREGSRRGVAVREADGGEEGVVPGPAGARREGADASDGAGNGNDGWEPGNPTGGHAGSDARGLGGARPHARADARWRRTKPLSASAHARLRARRRRRRRRRRRPPSSRRRRRRAGEARAHAACGRVKRATRSLGGAGAHHAQARPRVVRPSTRLVLTRREARGGPRGEQKAGAGTRLDVKAAHAGGARRGAVRLGGRLEKTPVGGAKRRKGSGRPDEW